MKETKRIETLDAFRGFAALSVVLFHYTTFFNKSFPHLYHTGVGFFMGYLGVHLFFIISGFVIFMTLENVKSSKEFVIKRFFRLFPTYWLCVCLTSIFLLAVHIFICLPPNIFSFRMSDILLNFTMIQGIINLFYTAHNIDGSYWSLLPELLFYIMMVVLYKFKLLSHIKIIGVIWIIVSLICILLHYEYFGISLFLNYQFSPLFFSGIMFYILWKNEKERKKFINHIIICLCLFTYFYLLFLGKSDFYLKCILITLFYGLFYLFVYGKLTLNYNALLFLGKISYPLYLLHQTIGFIILYYLNIEFGFSSIFAIIIPMVLTGFLAYMITKYFENILIKKIRNNILTKVIK